MIFLVPLNEFFIFLVLAYFLVKRRLTCIHLKCLKLRKIKINYYPLINVFKNKVNLNSILDRKLVIHLPENLNPVRKAVCVS